VAVSRHATRRRAAAKYVSSGQTGGVICSRREEAAKYVSNRPVKQVALFAFSHENNTLAGIFLLPILAFLINF
jgi:hypothetical protein